MKSIYALETIWKQLRRLDTKTLIHLGIRLVSSAENAESKSVRLGATRDLLDRAGFRPVDRHEIVKKK